DAVLDWSVGREGQGQPGVDDLRGRGAEVDAHGAGGGGGEVKRVDITASTGVVDGVAAQGAVGVEAVGVIAAAANQRVVAAAASDGVVARAAVNDRVWQGAVGRTHGDAVIAVLPDDMNQLCVGDGGRPALNGHGAVIDEDRPARVAGDHNGVVLRVARYG